MRKITKKFLSTVLGLSLLAGFSVNVASFASSEDMSAETIQSEIEVDYDGYYTICKVGKVIYTVCFCDNHCVIKNISPVDEENNIETLIIPDELPMLNKTMYPVGEIDSTCAAAGHISKQKNSQFIDKKFPHLKTIKLPENLTRLEKDTFKTCEHTITLKGEPYCEYIKYETDWTSSGYPYDYAVVTIKLNANGEYFIQPKGFWGNMCIIM